MKILIIKMSSMGDVIHLLPALTEAKKNNPDLQVDWVIEEGFAEIAAWHPAVNRVLPIALRRWRKKIIASLLSSQITCFIKKLRMQQYDLIIDAQGLIKSGCIARLAKGRRVGFNKASAREPLVQVFYQKSYASSWQQHAIIRLKELFASALGYQVDRMTIDYGINTKLFLGEADRNKKEKPYLFFIHATSANTKLWREEEWVRLSHLAIQYGYKIKMTFGSEAEKARAERLASQLPEIIVLPKMTIQNIASELLGAAGAVAVDTGLGHLSAALNVPCVSLYGVTDPQKIGTRGDHQVHTSLECSAQEVWSLLQRVIGHV